MNDLYVIANNLINNETFEELKHLYQDCNTNCIFDCSNCKLYLPLSRIKQSCNFCYKPDNNDCKNPFTCSLFKNKARYKPLELVNTETILEILNCKNEGNSKSKNKD